jgi:hypothetical protein
MRLPVARKEMCIVQVAVLEHAVLICFTGQRGLSSASHVAGRRHARPRTGARVGSRDAQQPPRYRSRSPGGKGPAAPSLATDLGSSVPALCGRRIGRGCEEECGNGKRASISAPLSFSPYASQHKRRRLVVGRRIESSPRCDPRHRTRVAQSLRASPLLTSQSNVAVTPRRPPRFPSTSDPRSRFDLRS